MHFSEELHQQNERHIEELRVKDESFNAYKDRVQSQLESKYSVLISTVNPSFYCL